MDHETEQRETAEGTAAPAVADPSTEQDGHLEPQEASSNSDSEFDQAWAEIAAAGKPEGVTPEDEPAPLEDQPQTPGEATADAPTPEAGEQEQATPAPEGTTPQATPSDTAPTPADVEREKQELKTWQGRKAKAQAEAEQLEAQLAELRRQVQESQQERPAPQPQDTTSAEQMLQGLDLSEEEREVLDEYPSLGKAMLSMAAKLAAREVDDRVAKRLTPIEQQVAAEAEAKHWDAIAQAHPDYLDIPIDDLQAWVRSQPYDQAQALMPVLQHGTTQQVIDLLTQFKAGRQPEPQPEPSSPTPNAVDPAKARRDLQRQGGAPVRRASGGPTLAPTADKNDFDGAWEEAMRTN